MQATNPLKKTIAPFYDRRNRVAFEVSILIFVLINGGFIIPYVFGLWRATAYIRGRPSDSERVGMLAMHLVPLILTSFTNCINAILYSTTVMPMTYPVCTIPVLIVGWITSIAILSNCHNNSSAENIKYCYQHHSTRYGGELSGASDDLSYGWTIVSTIIIVTYIGYLWSTSRALHRYRRKGSPAMPEHVSGLSYSGEHDIEI